MSAPTKRKAKASPGKVEPRRRIDWEAVERDYRTGKFTLRELEAKHHASYAQISRKAKQEAWTKDLREVIKQATDAALLRDHATKAQQAATDTILVAAEVNARVILSHRKRLADLADGVEAARSKLLALGDAVADVREAATFAQALGNLANATKTLIAGEREAFGIGAAGDPPPGDRPKRVVLEFVDAAPR